LYRDPSKYFIVYETGDNTTVAEGEATPLDLFYSRATNFGDNYEEVAYEPSENTDETEVTYGFDWLEHDAEILSGEAANTCNNGGTFYYAIWNQWQEDEYENVSNSDAFFRRVFWLDEDSTFYGEENLVIETNPIVKILATTQEIFSADLDIAETIYLYTTARDYDNLGEGEEIVAYEWLVNGVPIPESYTALGVDCLHSSTCKAPARVISGNWDGYNFADPGWSGSDNNGTIYPGYYQFSVRVMDNEGNWSKYAQIQKKIVPDAALDVPGFKIFLPLTTK
jgi:hypothetical protein